MDGQAGAGGGRRGGIGLELKPQVVRLFRSRYTYDLFPRDARNRHLS